MSNMFYTCTPLNLIFGDTYKECNCNFYDDHIEIAKIDGEIVKSFSIDNYADAVVEQTVKKSFLSKKHIVALSFVNGDKNSILEFAFKKESSAVDCFENVSKKIKSAIKERDNDTVYNAAILLQETNSREALLSAIERYKTIEDWKDSAAKIEECEKQINAIIEKENKEKQDKYDQAKLLAQKDTIEALKKAIKVLPENWKDSEQLAASYNKRISEIKEAQENEKKQKAYNSAIEIAKEDTIDSLENAIKMLPENWKDSEQLVVSYRKRIAEIKEAQENERKQKAYESAIEEAKKDTISSYQKAIRVLSSLMGWKDSAKLIHAFNDRIEEIKKKEEEDRKNKTYEDAIKLSSGEKIKDLESAISLFVEIEEWKDARQKIDDCKAAIRRIQEAAFYKTIDKVVETCRSQPEDIAKYKTNIQTFSKSAFDLILKNPYFILGVSTLSDQNKMLDVKDKIEKFARLKMSGGYKSSFDLKNIEKPARDISNIQSAIVLAKELSSQWLFFSSDKYCCWWDNDKIFDLYEKEKSEHEYDLVLACYFNRLFLDPCFSDKKKWNTVLSALGDYLALKDVDLLRILKKHISSMNSNSDQQIIESFKASITKPISYLLESATKLQSDNFAKLSIPQSLSEATYTAVVSNVTSHCYSLDIYVKEVENDNNKVDFEKLLSLIRDTKNNVYKNINSYISIVGENSTYAKRIKKKYKDTIWAATVIFVDNNKKKEAIPFIMDIYEFCDDNDKIRLRNTYGYDNLGLSENDLTPDELNDVALQKENEGLISEGIRLLKLAADRGSALAQSNLAARYFEGKGVSRNKELARLYWLKAAAQGYSLAQEALDNLFEIPHEHYDLGYVFIGYGEQKYVEISLNLIAYVRLLDDYNYDLYIERKNYRYYGGYQTQSPVRIGIPSSDHWHVVVDNDGEPMGAIQSYSCYTKTISSYY